jgi:hypothetical protein
MLFVHTPYPHSYWIITEVAKIDHSNAARYPFASAFSMGIFLPMPMSIHQVHQIDIYTILW